MTKADIDYDLTVIQTHERGEEVRDAFIEALKSMYNVTPNHMHNLGNDTVNKICVR